MDKNKVVDMSAGVDGYITGISPDPSIKAKQLWQFLCGKVCFRLSNISYSQRVCKICGTHTEYPPEYNITCIYPIEKKWNLSDYPTTNIITDGYTYNHANLKNCHLYIWD